VALLEVTDLRVSFHTRTAFIARQRRVLHLDKGEILVWSANRVRANRSAACRYSMIPSPGRIEGGQAVFDGVDLLRCTPASCAKSAPAHRDDFSGSDDLAESVPADLRANHGAAVYPREDLEGRCVCRALAMLEAVGIQDAPSASIPSHEFSGGMRQRVMIAMR